MKKVLSFVLILALVLGSFSFAFGLSDVTDATANSEAITVVSDLGIVEGFPDGSFMPEKAVNRAEFAAMITRALGVPDSALAGFSATSFKDTSGYGWAVKYLAFCESKGIMIGDGMGNVMPGRTINVNEAMTMVLRAVGYTENSALLVGTWPSKYVTLAQDLGLYDDVASMMTVDRANAAQVIYNALTVQKVQVDADGQTTGIEDKDGKPVNMLTAGLNCTAYNNGNAWVVEGGESSVINMIKYVGAFATAYQNSDKEIVAVNEVKSTFVVGEINTTFKVGTVLTDADDNEYTVKRTDYDLNSTTSSAHKTFVNGVLDSLTTTPGGTYKVAANVSGKQLLEVYSVTEWDANASFQWEDDMLDTEDAQLNGINFVKKTDDSIDFSTFQLMGASTLEDIAEDSIVYVYEAVTKSAVYEVGDITKVTVGTEKVTGTITQISGTDYTIDGKVYNKSDESTLELNMDLGDKGTAYLDYDGNVAYWDIDEASAGNYAVYIANDKTESFGVTTYALKLFTKDGVEITADAKDDISTAALNLAPTAGSIGRIVEYSLDKNGKVDSITSAAVATLNGKVNGNATLIGTTRVADGIVVFLFDGEDYSIGNLSDFDKDVTITSASLTMSAVKSDNKITALLVDDSVISGGDSVYGVINSTSNRIDADGDKFTALAGFKGPNAEAFDLLTDKAQNYGNQFVQTSTSAGLQIITVNASGIITNVEVANSTPSTGNVDAYVNLSASTISAVSGNFITVAGSGDVYQLADDVVIYVWDTDEFVVKTSNSILKNKNIKIYESDAGDTDLIYDYVLAW